MPLTGHYSFSYSIRKKTCFSNYDYSLRYSTRHYVRHSLIYWLTYCLISWDNTTDCSVSLRPDKAICCVMSVNQVMSVSIYCVMSINQVMSVSISKSGHVSLDLLCYVSKSGDLLCYVSKSGVMSELCQSRRDRAICCVISVNQLVK